MIRPTIRGWGMYAPERVMTNHELGGMIDTSDDWIVSRTGIRERHLAAPSETCTSMGVIAARKALQRAELEATDIDLVIVGTSSPEYLFPATACLIQDQLGVTGGAFDVEAGCTSFMYALAAASSFVATGLLRNVLVVGVEILSRILDWTDRTTCVLFGDGAGAVVVSEGRYADIDPQYILGSDGSGGAKLWLPAGGSHLPASEQTVRDGMHFVKMHGPEVFRFATGTIVDATRKVMDKAGISVDDIDLFIPHQANRRIIDYAMHRLHIPEERVAIYIEHYGNTSSASIPIALCEAEAEGKLHPGDTVVMTGFGAGLTWAAGAIQWAAHLPPVKREIAASVVASASV